jgi:hypothetical protein
MMNDIILMVEYLDGDVTVQRSMNQHELAVMLLEEDVILLSVNKPKTRTTHRGLIYDRYKLLAGNKAVGSKDADA